MIAHDHIPPTPNLFGLYLPPTHIPTPSDPPTYPTLLASTYSLPMFHRFPRHVFFILGLLTEDEEELIEQKSGFGAQLDRCREFLVFDKIIFVPF